MPIEGLNFGVLYLYYRRVNVPKKLQNSPFKSSLLTEIALHSSGRKNMFAETIVSASQHGMMLTFPSSLTQSIILFTSPAADEFHWVEQLGNVLGFCDSCIKD